MPRKKPGIDNQKVYRKYIHSLNGKKVLIKGNHDKMSRDTYSLFREVYDFGRDISIDKQPITLCHYPMRSWNKSFHGAWSLFGHLHGRLQLPPYELAMDVGVDVWNYKPIGWDDIKRYMYSRVDRWKERWDK